MLTPLWDPVLILHKLSMCQLYALAGVLSIANYAKIIEFTSYLQIDYNKNHLNNIATGFEFIVILHKR